GQQHPLADADRAAEDETEAGAVAPRRNRQPFEVGMIEVAERPRHRVGGEDRDDETEGAGGKPAQGEAPRAGPTFVELFASGRAHDVGEDESPEGERRPTARRAQVAKRVEHGSAVLIAERLRVKRQQRRVESFWRHVAEGSSPRFLASLTKSLRRCASSLATLLPLRVSR